jgi:hypothetical protein
MDKPTPAENFLEALYPEVQDAFNELAQVINKEGNLSTREKRL